MRICQYEHCDTLTDNPKYCSLSCGAKAQPRIVFSETRICIRPECKVEFVVSSQTNWKRYCSRSCSAQVNNLGKNRHGFKSGSIVCKHCGEAFVGGSFRVFCSVKCTSQNKNKEKIESWLDGSWDGTVTQGLASCIKTYLIQKAEFRCASPTCAVPGGFAEINPVTGRCPLEVDHIDGNCYNNSRENLIVVCPNCHALTPTYRALNKNSARAYRRK